MEGGSLLQHGNKRSDLWYLAVILWSLTHVPAFEAVTLAVIVLAGYLLGQGSVGTLIQEWIKRRRR